MSDLAERLRPHIEAMWADRDRIVLRVAQAVTGGVPSYASTPSSEVWIGMTRILERAVHGDVFAVPTDQDRLAALGTGAQGAGAGIGPDDLVAAVLLGAREVESDVMARATEAGLPAADLLEASQRFRAWAEQAAVWALQGLLGSHTGDPHRQLLEAQLLAELARGDVADARESMNRLGLDVSASYFAVAVAGASGISPASASALRLAHGVAAWGEPPAAATDVSFVGIVDQSPHVPDDLVVGLSDAVGLDSLGGALRDAIRAARVGLRCGRSGAVTLSDLGLLVPIHEDAALACRLWERWIRPLQAEQRHDLEATLRSWLELGGQIDAVARARAVHANTIRNRLDRVAMLLGDDWRSAQHRAELWAALQVEAWNLVENST